jgi:exopolysaccharide biosynthesis operon protein EpsL
MSSTAARSLRPLAALIASLCSLPAAAGPNDPLHLYGEIGYGHDDNLLRVPDGQPAFDGTLADSWWDREAGLIFDKTYSRQRISVIAKLSKYDFDHFKQLNYDGKDLQATWFWQLGNHLEGKLGATYAQVLAPYTDFVSDQRNLRRTHTRLAEGAWRFHSSWRVQGGFQQDKYDYDLLAQRSNNRTEHAGEVELDYLPASGSTIGLVARRVKGSYPYPRPVFLPTGIALFNDDFTQDELKVRAQWLATGLTSIDALVGYTRREQPSFGPGDTSGAAGKVTATYAPHGKLKYTAAVWRDFAPLESTVVSYTLNKGASVGAEWAATAKIKVNAEAIYERRNYNAREASSTLGDLRDSIRTASLRAAWAPRPTVQLTAALVHQARSGSVVLGTGSFTSNSITLSASAQF